LRKSIPLLEVPLIEFWYSSTAGKVLISGRPPSSSSFQLLLLLLLLVLLSVLLLLLLQLLLLLLPLRPCQAESSRCIQLMVIFIPEAWWREEGRRHNLPVSSPEIDAVEDCLHPSGAVPCSASYQ
jgi:hypothetical protein